MPNITSSTNYGTADGLPYGYNHPRENDKTINKTKTTDYGTVDGIPYERMLDLPITSTTDKQLIEVIQSTNTESSSTQRLLNEFEVLIAHESKDHEYLLLLEKYPQADVGVREYISAYLMSVK